MARGRPRVGAEAPLGAWVWETAKRKRGYKSKLEFANAIGVTQQAVNAWSNAKRAAVPDGDTMLAIRRVLKLSEAEGLELMEKMEEQKLHQEQLPPAPEPSPTTPTADVSTKQVVEYEDPYPNRAAAIELVSDKVTPQALSALKKVRNAEGDLEVDEWIERAFSLDTKRKAIERRASAGADVFDIRPALGDDPRNKRGKK